MRTFEKANSDLMELAFKTEELAQTLMARIHLNLLLGEPTKPLFDVLDALVFGTPEDQEQRRKQREREQQEESRKAQLPHALRVVEIALNVYGDGSREHQMALANADRLSVETTP